MLDLDAWEERAAIMQFDGGLSRFEAETQAARLQGYSRHEVMNEISKRNSEGSGHQRSAHERHAAHDMPGMQPHPAQEGRPVPERHVSA